jgi:hypothetical protein
MESHSLTRGETIRLWIHAASVRVRTRQGIERTLRAVCYGENLRTLIPRHAASCYVAIRFCYREDRFQRALSGLIVSKSLSGHSLSRVRSRRTRGIGAGQTLALA